MATFGKNKRRVHEYPDYSEGTPERHAPCGPGAPVGTTKEGVPIHGSHKQSWSEKDPILPDPTSEVDHRSGTKDVG